MRFDAMNAVSGPYAHAILEGMLGAPAGTVINGVPLEEKDYILDGTLPSDRKFKVTVPEGRLWMMGDNRSNSEDSRYHQDLPGDGTIPESAVVGKVWAIVWPVDRLNMLERPETFGNPALLTSGPDPQ